MAIAAAGATGHFAIAHKRTYASHADAYRKKIQQQQQTAFANAANVMFGTITSESAGLLQIAVAQATDRARQQLAATMTDITV